MSLKEQIHIFSKASMVIGIHGGGFTNILFCQPGTVIFEVGIEIHFNPCFKILSKKMNFVYLQNESTDFNNITETMVSMLEGRLDKQNSLLENLLRVETSASETGRKQFKATKGLSGNMLKGIGS